MLVSFIRTCLEIFNNPPSMIAKRKYIDSSFPIQANHNIEFIHECHRHQLRSIVRILMCDTKQVQYCEQLDVARHQYICFPALLIELKIFLLIFFFLQQKNLFHIILFFVFLRKLIRLIVVTHRKL